MHMFPGTQAFVSNSHSVGHARKIPLERLDITWHRRSEPSAQQSLAVCVCLGRFLCVAACACRCVPVLQCGWRVLVVSSSTQLLRALLRVSYEVLRVKNHMRPGARFAIAQHFCYCVCKTSQAELLRATIACP